MKWVDAYRERRTWKLLLGQLHEFELRNMRARARLIGLLPAPDAKRQQEIETATAAHRARLMQRTREYVAECEAIRDLPRSVLARFEFDWLRTLLGLGGDSWSAKIGEIAEKPEAAVYYVVKLKSLAGANRPELSPMEQKQIEEAIVTLDRSIHYNRRELKRIERDRRQAIYDRFCEAEELLLKQHGLEAPDSTQELRRPAHAYPGVVNSMKLESFSAAFARRIMALHPEWAALITPEENKVEGYSVFTLRIDFPSQNPQVSEPLSVIVDLDRVIYWRWFSKPSGGFWDQDDVYYFSEPQPDFTEDWAGFDRVIKWIEDFMKVEIVAFASDDNYGSLAVDQLESVEWRKGKKSTIVRSWRGTYDLDLGPESE